MAAVITVSEGDTWVAGRSAATAALTLWVRSCSAASGTAY
jgi:hypothetical protein